MSRTPFDLPALSQQKTGKKTLILDLDETLVHSQFTYSEHADYVVNIIVNDTAHTVFVHVRPDATYFLNELSQFYEIVIFTASIQEYANPVVDLIDP